MMKLLFVINSSSFFISHRLPIALAAKDKGYDVHIASASDEACNKITDFGFVHHRLPLSRSGTNPWRELYSFWAIWRLMRKVKPDLVHLVTIKPVLYGGIVARLTRAPAVVAAISGLGSMFVDFPGKPSLKRRVIELLYRIALRHPRLIAIFQNQDDRLMLLGIDAINDKQTVLIPGSGVYLSDFPVAPEPKGIPVVTFASRLLKEKGVCEFVKSAEILRDRSVPSIFCLAGAPDPGNPSSVTENEIIDWRDSELVNPIGHQADIAQVFASSNIVVLPSYYGEGLPKVLIEAAASGRAVITTDRPGCRDAIEPNVTGLLIPPRDATALADAIERLIREDELRHSMGRAGRELVERKFLIEKVIKLHLQTYQQLIDSCK